MNHEKLPVEINFDTTEKGPSKTSGHVPDKIQSLFAYNLDPIQNDPRIDTARHSCMPPWTTHCALLQRKSSSGEDQEKMLIFRGSHSFVASLFQMFLVRISSLLAKAKERNGQNWHRDRGNNTS